MQQDPRAALNQAQNIVQGKGLTGFFTRLFMGKSTLARFEASIDQAKGHLDRADTHAELRRTGRRASAKVLSIKDTGSLINFDPVVDLKLEVDLDSPRPTYQLELRTTVSKIAVPRAGDVIEVYVDRANPQLVALA